MAPPTLRLVGPDAAAGAFAGVKSVALIGNYPPRRCGIATFTYEVRRSLVAADPNLVCQVFAMTDRGSAYDYPAEVVCEIHQDQPSDYLAAATLLGQTLPDVICVEHEFGIFGGAAGEHLMMLLDATDRPVVSTLHTVLDEPNADQRRVFERLLTRSKTVIVMAERGRDILRRTWHVPDDKILVIPHGAPDRPLLDTQESKAKLGFAGHELLFTFGLLSPNKGIETAIRALPAIVAQHPTALYAVLGATHPHLIAQEGERYRESLLRLAQDLGVGDHVRLVDAYTDTDLLLDYLHAADIYITPYLNAAQVTSGTLSYAAALGKPIVSTPYWHAEELLAGGKGRLVPFADAQAIADNVIDLLSHPDARAALRCTVYEATRHTIWSCFAHRTLEAINKAAAAASRRPPRAAPGAILARQQPSLAGIKRMTDSCGMLQHSLFDIPDRRHGYCVDDNCRALLLINRLPGAWDAERQRLFEIYAAFVQHAWNNDEKCFRNFMSYERQWLERTGSEDSTGRSIWAVAVTAAEAPAPAHQRWADSLMGQILPGLEALHSPRASAFAALGLSAIVARRGGSSALRAALRAKLDRLTGMLISRRQRGLPWFEDYLAYDNARLPEGVIRAGLALGDRAAVELGLEALDWLCRRQSAPNGHFLPVSSADLGRPLESRSVFDQQPVEAAATIDACEAAFAATQDPRWTGEAERAFAWFFGANTLGASIACGDGDCFDGLTWSGPNENKGAESVLSLQLATCAYLRLTTASGGDLKTAGDR
jgi:glycosyltransferase involved in cell wall biosynthesis